MIMTRLSCYSIFLGYFSSFFTYSTLISFYSFLISCSDLSTALLLTPIFLLSTYVRSFRKSGPFVWSFMFVVSLKVEFVKGSRGRRMGSYRCPIIGSRWRHRHSQLGFKLFFSFFSSIPFIMLILCFMSISIILSWMNMLILFSFIFSIMMFILF